MNVGESASVARTFEKQDIDRLASLTGGKIVNDVHGRTVLPPPLIGGLFSQLLGMRLPGQGTNWLKQKMRFASPAYAGEALIATVTVVRVRPGKNLVNLATTCRTRDGRVVCEGEALVLCKEMLSGAELG